MNPNSNPDSREGYIAYLNAIPGDLMSFSKLNKLVWGHDEFSWLDAQDLKRIVTPNQSRSVTDAFDDERLVARCLRWCARGLKVELAVMKVVAEEDIGRNARKAHYEKRLHRSGHQKGKRRKHKRRRRGRVV